MENKWEDRPRPGLLLAGSMLAVSSTAIKELPLHHYTSRSKMGKLYSLMRPGLKYKTTPNYK